MVKELRVEYDIGGKGWRMAAELLEQTPATKTVAATVSPKHATEWRLQPQWVREM
jgi:hypothetical protein